MGSRDTVSSDLLEVPSGCSGEHMGREEEYKQGNHVEDPCLHPDERCRAQTGPRHCGWRPIWDMWSKDLKKVSCGGRRKDKRLGFPLIFPGPLAHSPEGRIDPATCLLKAFCSFQPSFSQCGGRPGGGERVVQNSSSSTSCVALGKWSNL